MGDREEKETGARCYTECFTVFCSPAAVIVGGIDTMSQSLALAKKPHVIIGKFMCWGS